MIEIEILLSMKDNKAIQMGPALTKALFFITPLLIILITLELGPRHNKILTECLIKEMALIR